MRVATYARVSTKSQEDRGSSLADQEERFTRFLVDTGHVRVRAYRESKSGGDVVHRKQFLAMLEELPHVTPRIDAVVVDSLDRFTRDMFLGVEMLGKLREMGVALWEIAPSADESHDGSRPFDMRRDGDRDYVWSKFQDAERERRRIKSRQVKRYAEQRKRGNTTTNRPGFGLHLVGDRKGYRMLEADPKTSAIVQEVDRRILSGESQNSVLEWLADVPGAWRSRRGLSLMLLDEHNSYVNCGVRTAETQSRLRQYLTSNAQTYGPDRTTKTTNEHLLSGLIACKYCTDAGVAPERALMHGHYTSGNPNPYNLVCDGRGRHPTFYASAHLVLERIMEKLERLSNPKVAQAILDRWAAEPQHVKAERLRVSLEAQLATCDADARAIDERIDAAFSRIAKGGALAAAAERAIERAQTERAGIEAMRAGLLAKLSAAPTAVPRALSAADLQIDASLFPFWERNEAGDGLVYLRSVRDVLKKWVAAIGPPTLERYQPPVKGKARLKLHWPLIDRFKIPERDWGPEIHDVTDTVATR